MRCERGPQAITRCPALHPADVGEFMDLVTIFEAPLGMPTSASSQPCIAKQPLETLELAGA